MTRFQRIAFFSLLATLPIQLGKHFWPHFSFVQGIRIDYLSPTLYISDICFIFLFIVSFHSLKAMFAKLFFSKFGLLFIISLIGSICFATNIYAAIFGTVKLLEFMYIGLFISQYFKRKDIESALFILTLGALVETVIIFFQFISQNSLGGFFYFLGERTFNTSTPGIATFQVNGADVLRAYGTFPHPNVVAFFLLFVFSWLLFSSKFRKAFLSYIKILALVVIGIGIFLTFSRIVILLLIGILLVKIKPRGGKNTVPILLGLFTICVLLFQRFEFTLVKDLLLRKELIEIGVKVFLTNFIFGTGLHNFFYSEILYQKTLSPILLQPVHNIYLYWISQTGIVGLIVLIYFLKKLIYALRKSLNIKKSRNFYRFVSIIVVCVGVSGMLDHYFLTLQQGQLLTAIIVGLCFSKIDSNEGLE